MENEVAKPGVFLELEAKQVFRFAFVPIGRIDRHTDAGHGSGIQRQTQNAVNPAGPRIQENVTELPLRALLDNQAAKRTAGFRKKELAERSQSRRMPHDERGVRAAILARRRNCRSKPFFDLSRQRDGIEMLRIGCGRWGDHHF